MVGPATTVQAAAKKVALGHFFLFPSYTALFYGWLSVFEGKGLEGGMQKFTDTWWDIFVAVLARGEHGELHVLSADVPRPIPQRRRAVLERVPVLSEREGHSHGSNHKAGVTIKQE